MADLIKHDGIVESINGTHIQVRIHQTSACASCSAKGHCGSAENKEKLIDVYTREANLYHKGDAVTIYGTTSMGFQAVLIAFVIPFIILITALFITISMTDGDEPKAALISLLVLVPYYLLVYLFKDKIRKKFSFTLKPINNN